MFLLAATVISVLVSVGLVGTGGLTPADGLMLVAFWTCMGVWFGYLHLLLDLVAFLSPKRRRASRELLRSPLVATARPFRAGRPAGHLLN